jgi:hypothetical protein
MKSLLKAVSIAGAILFGSTLMSVPNVAKASDPTVCHSQGECTVCDGAWCHVWYVDIRQHPVTGEWYWHFEFVFSYPNPFPDHQQEN